MGYGSAAGHHKITDNAHTSYIFASRRFVSVRLSLALRAAPRERRREAAVGSGLGVLGGLKKVGDSSGDTAGGEKGLSI